MALTPRLVVHPTLPSKNSHTTHTHTHTYTHKYANETKHPVQKRGFFGPRDPMAEKIFRAGEKQFKEYMREVKRERKRSLSIISTSSASSSGSAAKGDLLDDQTTPKLPPVVFACAVAIVCAALSFTAMTSMTGLVWLNLFNYGPVELGTFLTCIGLVSIIMNICGVKTAIRKFGPYKTALTACTLQSIGIAGFTFIDIFPVHVVYFVAFIAIGWSLTLPTMLFIAGEFTPPEIRGMATGIIAGSMSLGFAICPLMSGPAFESDILKLEHKHGSFSHVFFLIAGLGFGAVELFVICMYIGPKARSLHLNRPKERESGSKASRPGEDSAGENISPKDVEMQ